MTDQVVDQTPAPVEKEISQTELDNFFDTRGGENEKDQATNTQQDAGDDQSGDEKPVSASGKDNQASDDESVQDEEEGATVGDGDDVPDQQRYKAIADSERVRRKEIQKQIDKLNQENEQLKNTFNRILTKAQEQAQQHEQEKAPSFDDDPIAALRHENQQLKNKMNGIEESHNQSLQERQYQAKQQEFVNNYRAKANEFKKTTPDFDDAYKYLLENRMQEFEAAGYTEDQAKQLVIEDEAAIVANHLSKNSNPAEAIYKLSKLRGYKGAVNANAQDQVSANEKKIATLERGLKVSKSVNSSGSNSKENITLEDVANMDEDEFNNFDWNKVLKMG